MALPGCAHCEFPAGDTDEFPTRIVTPPCANTSPPIGLELLRAARDPRPHKPSVDLRRYLVDLRIVQRGSGDLWLLVDEDTFPSAVDSVHADIDPYHDSRPEPKLPRETWWFSGNHIVHAYSLGEASETSLRNIAVSTADPAIPVSLGTITVDGLSPQEWVRRSGGLQPQNSGEPRVPASFEAYCTTWFDIAAEAEHESQLPR